MDRNLIEKITEMVLSKIQNDTTYLPLSDAELTDWQRLNSTALSCSPPCRTNDSSKPLTEEEINEWSTLNKSFQISCHDTASRPGEKKVRFQKYV